MNDFKAPVLATDSKGRIFVSFRLEGKRYRWFNGKNIGLDIQPNRTTGNEQLQLAEKLRLAVWEKLSNGWTPESAVGPAPPTLLNAIQSFPLQSYSATYQKALKRTITALTAHFQSNAFGRLTIDRISTEHCYGFLLRKHQSPASFNFERKHFSTILSYSLKPYSLSNPIERISKKKEKAVLHKPIRNVAELLTEIESFHPHLHLCCLLTFGCLLRPHQEVRLLTWGDFNEACTHIALSGQRNKSGRNRIVPIPDYVRPFLNPGGKDPKYNIFTGIDRPYNSDYFKTLWSRFKAQSSLLEPQQTLYSFRHTGAIQVFRQTGSIHALQTVMGHSNMQVTLGYLRGLEVPQISQSQMPQLS